MNRSHPTREATHDNPARPEPVRDLPYGHRPEVMVMSALLFLCSAGLLVSCQAPSPTAVDPDPGLQVASIPTAAQDGCAQVEVTLSGRDRVSVRFPTPEACSGGLILVSGGEARYSRPGSGTLELPVAVRNATASDVVLPARLLLAPDSAVVLVPAGLRGQAHKRPVARNADGTVPGGELLEGAWRWAVGGAGTLAAGAHSPSRTLAFMVPDGVQRFLLAFRMEAETAALDTIWPVLTGYAPMLDTTAVVSLTSDPDGDAYFRTAIIITFEAGVSNTAKAAFFARHSITVLGVSRANFYYVQIPDPGMEIQAFYSIIDSLRAEPETRSVLPIMHRGMRLIGLARFPDDGGGMVRADWLDGGSSTWAMRAVRATLAWGCETGDYGGQPVRVGVFEWKHQPAHPELSRSTPHHREPPDDSVRIANSRPLPPDSVAARERHAAGVTGLLGAQGDNGSGIAGMMWRSSLYLYSGLSAQHRPGDGLLANVEWLTARVADDRIRVLNLSSWSGFSRDARAADVAEYSLEVMRLLRTELLDSLPDLLVVVAAGNDAFRGTVNGYIQPGSGVELGALLRLRQNPAYRDRIIVVTGTGPGGSHSEFSNYFTDATDIAAPAVAVSTLDRWTGQSGASVPVRFPSGTSYAAPLVAGTAGLLLSMDPTLTAAEVKDYIVRGAAWPRYRPETSRIEPPPEVSGLSGVRLLDAYGALSLLSNKRKGTPLCGVRVEVDEGGLVLDRTRVPGGERISLAGMDTVGYPSVAQGGRRIAVTDLAARRVRVFDHTGRSLHEVADAQERQYLERDTADLRWVTNEEGPLPIHRKVVRIRGPRGSETTVDPAARVTSWPTRITPTMRVSADGKRVAFDVLAVDWDLQGDTPSRLPMTYGAYLVGADGGALVTVERTDCVEVQRDEGATGCEALNDLVGLTASWDHDSRNVTLAFPAYEGDEAVRTRVRRVTAAGGPVSSTVIPDRLLYSLETSGDDRLLAGLELSWSGEDCYFAWRAVAPLGTSMEQRRVGDGSAPACRFRFGGNATQSIGNAAIADVTLALGAPGAGSLMLRGSSQRPSPDHGKY